MSSKYFMKWVVDSSYAPVCSSSDLFIHLIYHSEKDSVDYDLSLRELLGGEKCGDAASMFVFEATGHGLFILWTTVSGTTSTNSLEDALAMSQKFIGRRNQRQICVSFTPERAEEGEVPEKTSRSILAVLARYDRELPPSLGMPMELQQKIAPFRLSAKSAGLGKSLLNSARAVGLRYFTKNRFLAVLGAIACLSVVLVFSAKYFITGHPPDRYHSWIKYDTRGSIGPKYQLDLTGQNVSKWNSYIQGHGEWALRIDDQAIIPLHLMDDEERHYQEWIQNRYPEMNQIRLNRDYINETWLSSPLTDQIPADDLFHFSHCVLALKRYIKAKETGRHVCGRDLDYEHMHHCLDALDWWAFPSGKRAEAVPNSEQALWWRTKVCFD